MLLTHYSLLVFETSRKAFEQAEYVVKKDEFEEHETKSSDPEDRLKLTIAAEEGKSDQETFEQARKEQDEFFSSCIDNTTKILESYSLTLFPELRDSVMNMLEFTSQSNLEEIQRSSESSWELKKISTFMDTSKAGEGTYKVLNFLTLGLVGYRIRKRIERIAEHHLAWQVLEAVTERGANDFREDVQYLRKHGNDELAGKVEDIAAFYQKASVIAARNTQRMERYLADEMEMTEMMRAGVNLPDLQPCKRAVLEKYGVK